jgi:mono/diheme cytochrome c family protein
MDDTFFYVAGGVLIVVALVVSLVGMRNDKFPSGRLLAVGMVLVAALVGATAYGAVKLSQSEQADRLEEANTEGNVESEQQSTENQDVGSAPAVTPTGGGSGGGSDEGAKIFVATGCGGCHTLADLGGDAQGSIGPNLDEALADKDEKFIQTSIEDPSAYVEQGYPDGTMPQNYKDQLTAEEITALVSYLHSTAGASN